jgi:hypothetical protein
LNPEDCADYLGEKLRDQEDIESTEDTVPVELLRNLFEHEMRSKYSPVNCHRLRIKGEEGVYKVALQNWSEGKSMFDGMPPKVLGDVQFWSKFRNAHIIKEAKIDCGPSLRKHRY